MMKRNTSNRLKSSTMARALMVLMLVLPMAVAATYVFKTLDARDGLTSSQVNCILKDKKGYMWFGTPAGLYRFDGYVFRNFQSDSQDGSSLPDSYINSLQEASDGSLWIGTATGYCIYNPQTETFERDMKQVMARYGIQSVPSIIYFDQHHNMWGVLPNRGVVCYNVQQQLYDFPYGDDARGIPQGNICSLSECRDGALIVYDDGRIVCCDVMHQQHKVWTTTEIADRKLRRSKSLKAFADQKDNIWLYGQGTLFLYNKNTKTWDTTIGNQVGLTGIGVDNAVNGMGADKKGNVWIGTDRAGLIRMDVNTFAMEHVQPKTMSANMTLGEVFRVQSIYVDNSDLLWVGTEKSGVAYCGDNIYRFESDFIGDVTAIAQADSGRVWYGTGDRGVIGFSGPLASLKVSCMATANDGSLWVGSKQNGLTRIKGGTSTIFSTTSEGQNKLIDDHVNALCKDKGDNIWIGTGGGLQLYSSRMNTFSNYTRESGKLKSNTITSLFYTQDSRLLIGTGEGLSILNTTTTEIEHLTGNRTGAKRLTNSYITQVYQDSRGLIWLGTREGANILNLENDSLYHLTERQGLCNNNICGITEDKNKNMWITTSNGVSRVVVQRNPDDGSHSFGLYNYTTADGLQSNEFNPGSILTKSDGDVLLGGLYGVNWTRKQTSSEASELPDVILTQLLIGEEEVKIGHEYDGRVILTQALNETQRIDLGHSQNTFTIKFAAGNYQQSERLQFKWAIDGKGLYSGWRDGDALKHGVTFLGLPSGTYTLQVSAVNANGNSSNHIRTIVIHIDRHWLFSWWMVAVYLAIAVIAFYVWRFGMQQVKEIKAKKQAVIDELRRQSEEIKAASDDLRQPMARMTSIIGNLSETEKSLEEREQLNALHSQMLQVITRVSDMQSSLEHPEEKAKQSVHSRYELNAKGEMNLPDLTVERTERRARRTDSPTSQYVVVFIDDNVDFLKFINGLLRDVYDFHVYNDIHKAAQDLLTTKADIVVCKQEMRGMSGSELCNKMKMTPATDKIKFVLMTEGVLTPQDMKSMNITLAADDYLPKPFNVQEAIVKFNTLLGLGPIQINANLIEGAETRMLEDHNASMTTATETMNMGQISNVTSEVTVDGDEINLVETRVRRGAAAAGAATTAPGEAASQQLSTTPGSDLSQDDGETDELLGDYSMLDQMDHQLLKNIEQYVLQNMSRGQISLEEMANAMGMGRVPFFHRVRSVTGKTPAELVRDLRLKHACILLKRTNINMSELASNVGFMTGENFINVFKEKFGLSPLEYRLKHRK